MRSAARKLCQYGAEALRPQQVNDKWRSPAISKRIAGDLRKKAIRTGTYGSFDSVTGVGWDPMWDAPGKISSIRPPKETKRERTREARAQRIENLVAQADQKIEEYRLEREAKKPFVGIEYVFKQLTKGPGTK